MQRKIKHIAQSPKCIVASPGLDLDTEALEQESSAAQSEAC